MTLEGARIHVCYVTCMLSRTEGVVTLEGARIQMGCILFCTSYSCRHVGIQALFSV